MRRLIVYNQISLDGYFTDRHQDMNWAHKHDPEWSAFTAENAKGGGELVFGRVTYDMMAGYWPTEQAIKTMPAVAEGMNRSAKVVFSRRMDHPSWNNTRLIKGDIIEAMRGLKREAGPEMVIMGSGTIVAQMTDARLIDEYCVVLNSIVLGGGRTMFDGVERRLELVLTKTRSFKNGNTVLCYEPRS